MSSDSRYANCSLPFRTKCKRSEQVNRTRYKIQSIDAWWTDCKEIRFVYIKQLLQGTSEMVHLKLSIRNQIISLLFMRAMGSKSGLQGSPCRTRGARTWRQATLSKKESRDKKITTAESEGFISASPYNIALMIYSSWEGLVSAIFRHSFIHESSLFLSKSAFEKDNKWGWSRVEARSDLIAPETRTRTVNALGMEWME